MAVDYTYAVARLRAVEAAMPDRAWFMRMGRSPARQLLAGVREHYAGFEGIDALHDFESGIEADMQSLYDMLSSVLGEGPVTEFLRAPADFDNYMLAVKARMLGAAPVLLPFGTVSAEEIEAAASGGDTVRLPDHLKALHEALGPSREGDLPVALDRVGERAKWKYMLEAAPSGGARRWVELRIDRVNIKSFARLRLTGLRRGDVSDVWISGGTIEASRFAGLVGEPFEDFLSFLGSTDWRGLLSRGFDKNMPAGRIDIAIDGALFDLIGGSRSHFFDITPLLYHIELRERNSRILRTIFTGRINGLPEEDVAGRVEELLS